MTKVYKILLMLAIIACLLSLSLKYDESKIIYTF